MVVEAALDFPLLGLVKEAEEGVTRFVWLNRGATALAILCWPATAFLWRGGPGRLSLALPLALAIVLSFLVSDAALAGLIVGALTVLAAQLQRKLGRALLVVMTLFALAGTPVAVKELHARGWHEAEWLSPSAQHRVEIWDFTVDLILEKPLTGWGFDVSREISRLEIISPETGRTVMPLHPHNGGLQILLELGAIGSAIVFVLMWLLIKRLDALPNPVSRNFAVALVATTLTIASISFGLWQNQWLAMMISAALTIPLTARGAETQARSAPSVAERTEPKA
jgi:O-antigen ligase